MKRNPSHRPPSMTLTAVALLLLGTASCILHNGLQIEDVPTDTPQEIRSSVKAHLVDGTTVVFRSGAEVGADAVTGQGFQFGLTGFDSVGIRSIPLSDIMAMEAIEQQTNVAGSIVATVLGTAATGLVAAVGAVAIFGSCPTFYSDSAGHEVLEAEGFSYSIAPLFEARDVDRLRATADADGVVRIDVRNEALETHYINHLEVLEVRHASDEMVVPMSDGRLLVVRDLAAPAGALDGAGRDVGGTLAAADGDVFATATDVLASRTAEDLRDHIDLTLPDLPPADSVVLVFRMRNSLLATVLFYDIMLGRRGAAAIDWQIDDLQRLSTAVAIGEWAREHLGMRVEIERDGRMESVGRVGDPGPIAWKDVAIVVPVPDDGRVRLSFAADSWRIDRVAVSMAYRAGDPRSLPLARVNTVDGDRADALASASDVDERYLVTTPGERFTAEFDAGPSTSPRTFLLASQGYYIEWIRRDWLANVSTDGFRPTADVLADAMVRWGETQDSLESRFHASRIPVR